MHARSVLVAVVAGLRVYRVPGVHLASAVGENIDGWPYALATFSISPGNATDPIEREQVSAFRSVSCEVKLAYTSHSSGEQPLSVDLDDLHRLEGLVGLDQMLHARFLVDDV